ncbi:SH3 domain-containing protein [Rhizobium grahamii]|uniref:SH3b domain-containing protein n=1 Tax=Rhizobium grahamii CCGE 502 TaxID=990285 RepID=S3HQ51_9HYPH|nr:SH3 domain-containing protein [Rhizobium grahamii]EPE95471.1 hypothetical protein RGCCGE502_26333 [Rhizobium grahamii CCGE 502]
MARRPYRAARRLGVLSAGCLLGIMLSSQTTAANPAPQQSIQSNGSPGRETGLRVPRFVSVKSKEARMRVGPSLDYATQWIYQAPGLPLEIIAEYDNWRQVRDCDGISGWMHRALLSSHRTALIGPWITSPVPIRAAPRASAQRPCEAGGPCPRRCSLLRRHMVQRRGDRP